MPAAAVGADGWGVAAALERDTRGDAGDAEVAANDNGDAFAIWHVTDGAFNEVYVNRYVPGAGWQNPQRLVLYGGDWEQEPEIGIDAAGNAIAVWQQSIYATYQIAYSEFVAGQGWNDPQYLAGNLSLDQRGPHIDVAPNGAAVVAWAQCCDPTWQIWGRVKDPKSGWGAPAQLNAGQRYGAAPAAVSINAAGQAVGVWPQGVDAWYNNTLMGSSYEPGMGWSLPDLVETGTTPLVDNAVVAIDARGNAFAAWERFRGGYQDLAANRLVAGGGWGRAELIESDDSGYAQLPRVAVDAEGNAMVVWNQVLQTKNSARARPYTIEGGWGDTRALENVAFDDIRICADVGMDASGNSVVTWVDVGDTGFLDLKSSRYSPTAGWTDPVYAEDIAGHVGFFYSVGSCPRLAVAGNGRAMAVWSLQDQNQFSVWANSFVPPDVTLPVIAFTTPSLGFVTNLSSLQVTGLTETGVRVSVNGVAATVGADGSFSLYVALQPGTNTIEATATDPSGNSATVSRFVTFADPLPGLESALIEAQRELEGAVARADAIEADANATAADLDAAQADLAAAQVRVTSLESALSATAAALAANNSRLATVEGSLAETNRQLSEAQAQLVAARSDLNGTKTTAPGSADGSSLGVILGVAGIAIGGLGVAMASRAGRTKTAVSEARPMEPREKG